MSAMKVWGHAVLAVAVGLVVLLGVLVAPVAWAGCSRSSRWRENDRAGIRVYVLDDAEMGLNANTIGIPRDVATREVLAAIQAWNDAGTGAPRLVFAGYRTRLQGGVSILDDEELRNSIFIDSRPSEEMRGFIGLSTFVNSDDRRGRISLVQQDDWAIDPAVDAESEQDDLRMTLVHEFGHSLGLGHPWLAAESDIDVADARPNACAVGSVPGNVSDGGTVGVMHYVGRISSGGLFVQYPREGSLRRPWKDDIEAVTLGEGGTFFDDPDTPCRRNAECTDCPPGRPDCVVDELVCGRTAVQLNEQNRPFRCEVEQDCDPGFQCERGVRGIFGSGSGLESCDSDEVCNNPEADPENWTRSCDLDSGKCVALVGTCVQRRCGLVEAPTDPIGLWTDTGQGWTGPVGLPTGQGLARSSAPPGLSAADDFDGRKLTLATVSGRRQVEYHEALDGSVCEEIEDHVVLDDPAGRTWLRPATATGGGQTMVAWLEESFSNFDTRVRFAVRDTAGVEWDLQSSVALPGYNRFVGLGYAESEGQFALSYLDRDFRAFIRLLDPSDGSAGPPQPITPLDFLAAGVSRPSCTNDRCRVYVTGPGTQMFSVDGTWAQGLFFPDNLGQPVLVDVGRTVAAPDGANRGQVDSSARWLSWTDPDPQEAGAPFELERLQGETQELPWDAGGPPMAEDGADQDDGRPRWTAAIGTYAPEAFDGAQIAVLARATRDESPIEFTTCCTPSECGPVPPEDDPAFVDSGCDPLDESTWGEAGCPCRPLDATAQAVELCSLSGGETDDPLCEPIVPDGTRSDRYCFDDSGQGDGAVVCGETPAGNHICKQCGVDGTAFGCPCDEVECEFEGLSCWGSGWGANPPNLELGRCWEPESPPNHACIEVCEGVSFFDNAASAVCVGPHLGNFWGQGSPYLFSNGPLQGHPAYCSTVSCIGDPVDAGACEEANPGQVCVAENQCGLQCVTNDDCYDQGYPDWYGCVQDGLNLCLPIQVCNAKPEVCD